jgi:hypothetical protein
MTISTQTSTITYVGNGATTVWSFPFVGVNGSDIEVIYTDSSGAETTLNPSQYTLVINPVPVGGLWGIGGSVTYPTSGTPIQAGTFITINRIVPYTQSVTISNQGPFYPQSVEQALDLLELQIQQIQTLATYAISAPIVDQYPPNTLPPAAERANGYLGFDNFGQPVIFTAAPAVATVTYAAPRAITTTGTNTVSVLQSDSLGGVSIYQSSTPVTTVQLPVSYGPYPIFDGSKNSSTYPIKVLPPVGLTIEGRTSWSLGSNGSSLTFYNDGTQITIG